MRLELIVETEQKTELWTSLACLGASDYEVSSIERVRSYRSVDRETGRPYQMRLAVDKCGYLTFRAQCDDGRERTIKVYRAVAMAFIGPCPEGQIVRHLNDIKVDNRLENLALGTRTASLPNSPNDRPSLAGLVRTDLRPMTRFFPGGGSHEPHPPPLPQVHSRHPPSAHVPHERTTCFFSASRARNTRTAALPAVIPASAA